MTRPDVQLWKEFFLEALGGAATAPGTPEAIVAKADAVATAAALLAQKRELESRDAP